MNTQTQEALKMAKSTLDKLSQRLENKDCGYVCSKVFKDYRKTISAIEKEINACKEASQQPAQEPVAKGFIRSLVSIDKNGIETWKEEPFYTSPPSWQGLSDDKINVIWDDVSDVLGFAKAIEAELKEKNAK